MFYIRYTTIKPRSRNTIEVETTKEISDFIVHNMNNNKIEFETIRVFKPVDNFQFKDITKYFIIDKGCEE